MKNAIENTRRLLPDHFSTLIGERPAGSQWGRPFAEDDFSLPWKQATLDGPEINPSCRYFRLNAWDMRRAFPAATVGAIPLTDVAAPFLEYVTKRSGAHGPELCIPARVLGHESAAVRASEAWLIVGPHEGSEVIFTAHPGPLTVPLRDPDASIEDLVGQPIAVKMI